MGSASTVAGISDHGGWAISVCISASTGKPRVVDRRRMELIEAGLPKHPYHHETLDLDPARAEQLVQEVQESANRYTERALGRLQSDLQLTGIVLRVPPIPSLPESVAVAHASYHVMVRADSMIYHHALCKAASVLGIPVELITRGEEFGRAAAVLGTTEERLEQWLAELRAKLGAPWQKDHREAAARAIAGLGKHAQLKLPAD